MSREVKEMIIKVIRFDCMVGAGILFLSFFLSWKYVFFFLLGLIIARTNFILYTIVTNFLIGNAKFKFKSLSFLIYYFRMIIIAAVGFITYRYDPYYTLSFIMGFCSHFISLILYSFSIRNIEERK